MRGVDVDFTFKAVTGHDDMGEPVYSYTTTTVSNVLWHEATTDEMDESNRMFGVMCDLSIDIPKTLTGSIEGAHVTINGKDYRILGDPQGYMAENTPTPWNRHAMAVRADG